MPMVIRQVMVISLSIGDKMGKLLNGEIKKERAELMTVDTRNYF
jgi:hypothetical protein